MSAIRVKLVDISVDGERNLQSSAITGIGSCCLTASVGFDFIFANDLKMSPAVLSFLTLDFDSDLFSILAPAEGTRVDFIDDSFSIPLPFWTETELFDTLTLSFVVDFVPALEVGAATGGAYLAVLRYGGSAR